MKKYDYALIVGRFQPLHNEHINLVYKALDRADKVIILIGSAQESRTTKNPFSYKEREKMFLLAFPEELLPNLIIKPLNDIGAGNNSSWGEYVIRNAKKEIELDKEIGLFVTGEENRRVNWFGDAPPFEILSVAKDETSGILSATKVRESMLNGTQYWKENIPSVLHNYYESLIPILRQSTNNKTNSI